MLRRSALVVFSGPQSGHTSGPPLGQPENWPFFDAQDPPLFFAKNAFFREIGTFSKLLCL
jgi:hypothetical protein